MEKRHIERRIQQMRAEGVEFIVNADVAQASRPAGSRDFLVPC